MKDYTRRAQAKKVFDAFQEKPKTMKMVSVETSVMRENICRYLAKWREQNKIVLIKEDYCKITNHKAGFYTTDPEKVKEIHNQMELAEV